MKKTLGGDRLGAGKKIKVDMHGWGRSTFNQNRIWRSTMASGVLTPCFVEVGLNGTTFDIDINALGHTIPTIAPLFGSFKMQVDVFACPVRLYQGLLHNNALNLGLDMKSVLFPTITIPISNNRGKEKTSTSSLLNYLGIKGINNDKNEFNAIPILAYYDIVKNYYINKQEDYAKVIGNTYETTTSNLINYRIQDASGNTYNDITLIESERNTWDIENWINLNDNSVILTLNFNDLNKIDGFTLYDATYTIQQEYPNINLNIGSPRKLIDLERNTTVGEIIQKSKTEIQIQLFNATYYEITRISFNNYQTKINIIDFETENLDRARREILKHTDLDEKVIIGAEDNEEAQINFLPYSINVEQDNNMKLSQKELNGLCLKTYQNDIFNTWLSTEYVNTINQISSITPIDGQITIDAIILAKKVYNVLNRIAVSGGTYQDWQEANFGEKVDNGIESPIYIGGMSTEITFEEVVSTASAQNSEGNNQPLASLGGKGVMKDKKGGHIVYKCQEPCFIIGIVSITPRIDYHQGNKWYMTDIFTPENFHKPEFDGIGFQNLIANNVHWACSPNTALAKQTAWINYQTSYNEVFGNFAKDEENEENSLYFMTLRRNYEINSRGEIEDFTSYIDPSKFNYPFAGNELTEQNFWIQLGFNVKSRRKMASYEIPNL